MKKQLKRLLACICTLSLLTTYCVTVEATETTENTQSDTDSTVWSGGLMEDPYEKTYSNLYTGNVGLSEKYDPRTYGYTTDTRDQGDSELCWMYSIATAAEHNISKRYGSKFTVSAAHGGVALSNSIRDGGNGYYTNIAEDPGNSAKALQYFTNWNTPIFNYNVCNWESAVEESDYPLSKVQIGAKTFTDSDFINAESLFNVTSTTYLTIYDSYSVKVAIKDYGGAVTYLDVGALKMGVDANGEKNSYSQPNIGVSNLTHAVTLVGWDDNYSKDNFINTPPGNGAWLVKNSYEENSYFWLSYYEGALKENNNYVTVIKGVQKATDNEYMLSYDYFVPAYKKDLVYRENVYLCNVFDISEYRSTYNQISKVMFYLKTSGCSYNVKIIQLGADGNIPTNLDSYSILAAGEYSGEGYLTVELESPFTFSSDNLCAVILELTPKLSTSKIYIPHESYFQFEKNGEIINPEINSGESFYSTINDEGVLDWIDCDSDSNYTVNGSKGNLIIRPILSKSNIVQEAITLTPSEIVPSNSDVDIQIDSDVNLFNIHTSNNYILRQDADYTRNSIGVTLKNSFLSTLGDAYTELIFEFNNDTQKSVIINPKSIINSVTITGSPIVGEVLTASCVGSPARDEYDVNYQWQFSTSGEYWYNIPGATNSIYTISDEFFLNYIRVKVTAHNSGNVVYPTEVYSDSTACKAVILGDVDLNGIVTVTDATILQKYSAALVTFNAEQLLAADVNKDGYINVKDVTAIQLLL